MRQLISRALVEDGFAVFCLKQAAKEVHAGYGGVAQALTRLTGSRQWQSLSKEARELPPSDATDDPTSLGLQIFSTAAKGMTHASCFGGEEVLTALRNGMHGFHLPPGMEKRLTIPQAVEEHGNVVAKEMNALVQWLAEGVAEETGGSVEAVEEKVWQHETLANFFTPHPVGMYPHTDKSLLTLLAVPCLWDTPVDSHFAGIEVLMPKKDAWVDVEKLLMATGQHAALLVAGDRVKLLAGSESVPVVAHRVQGRDRHPQRVSFAHFFCSQKPGLLPRADDQSIV